MSSFGSWAMKKREKLAGKEPDSFFYVQTVAAIGNRINLDFDTDPPPDRLSSLLMSRPVAPSRGLQQTGQSAVRPTGSITKFRALSQVAVNFNGQ